MFNLVGLGNPGVEYAKTRHNVGFVIVDEVAKQLGLSWIDKPKFQAELAKNDQATLIKPMSFMNRSGQPVRAVLDYFGAKEASTSTYQQLYVIHDDLDLELGSYKIQLGKGPHGHNGLLSLYQQLGTKEFWHVRVGVDGRAGARVIPPDAYVLNQFDAGEKERIQTVVEQLVKELIELIHASI